MCCLHVLYCGSVCVFIDLPLFARCFVCFCNISTHLHVHDILSFPILVNNRVYIHPYIRTNVGEKRQSRIGSGRASV